MIKAFFCDRDGIVNQRLKGDYVKKIKEFRFIEDFFQIFEYAVSKNYLPILITNQQGIGKGLMTSDDLIAIHQFMNDVLLTRTGSRFQDIFYCGDLAKFNSFRRKPNPGMILEAAQKYNIDLLSSFMLGDSNSDIDAGKSAECKTILINSKPYLKADYQFLNHKNFIDSLHNILV